MEIDSAVTLHDLNPSRLAKSIGIPSPRDGLLRATTRIVSAAAEFVPSAMDRRLFASDFPTSTSLAESRLSGRPSTLFMFPYFTAIRIASGPSTHRPVAAAREALSA